MGFRRYGGDRNRFRSRVAEDGSGAGGRDALQRWEREFSHIVRFRPHEVHLRGCAASVDTFGGPAHRSSRPPPRRLRWATFADTRAKVGGPTRTRTWNGPVMSRRL